MGDLAVRADGIGKRYRKGADISGTLLERFRRRGADDHFWALKDVSFEIRRGELLGIIGPNGSGKSTLLRILSRITRPNAGTADIFGRVGSLLSIGTGFHRDLTGRENIHLNGSLLGLKRAEIRQRFDAIVAFAGTEEFLDTPIKRYSSGMLVRLGFAIAAFLDQEIMLVDEVLAVGDAAFQRACLTKIGDVARNGKTVILVSHEMPSIAEMCHRAIWLDGGAVQAEGRASGIVDRYLSWMTERTGAEPGNLAPGKKPGGAVAGSPCGWQVRLLDGDDRPVPYLISARSAKFLIGIPSGNASDGEDLVFTLTFHNRLRVPVAIAEGLVGGIRVEKGRPGMEILCELDRLPLSAGRYSIDLSCRHGNIPTAHETRVMDFWVVEDISAPGLSASRHPGGHVLLTSRWSRCNGGSTASSSPVRGEQEAFS